MNDEPRQKVSEAMPTLPNGLLAWVTTADPGTQVKQRDRAGTWTAHGYDELARRTRATAAALTGRGLTGRRVGLLVRRPHDLIPALFGSLLAGAVPSILPPPLVFEATASYAARLGRAFNVLDPSAVLFDEPSAAIIPLLDGVGAALPVDGLITGSDELGERRRPPAPADCALIQFTSGSSGAQKGLSISWAALTHNVRMVGEWLSADPAAEIVASWLPTHHDMGLVGFLIPPVAFQAEAWYLGPEQFVKSPMCWLTAIHEARATLTAAPPFALTHLLRHRRRQSFDQLDLSCLRALVVGAERLTPDPLEAWSRALAPHGFRGEALMPAYGLAEATLAVTGCDPREVPRTICLDTHSLRTGQPVQVRRDRDLLTRVGSANPDEQWLVSSGRPLRGVSIDIVDDDGRPLDDGHLGEVVVRSPSIASGYLTPMRSAALNGEELRSGDAGFIWEGELFVFGRVGDSLKVRGVSVYAEGLEAQLTAVPDPPSRLVVLLGSIRGQDHALVLFEGSVDGEWVIAAQQLVLDQFNGTDVAVLMARARRGTISLTSSGKPQRRPLWERFARGDIDDDLQMLPTVRVPSCE